MIKLIHSTVSNHSLIVTQTIFLLFFYAFPALANKTLSSCDQTLAKNNNDAIATMTTIPVSEFKQTDDFYKHGPFIIILKSSSPSHGLGLVRKKPHASPSSLPQQTLTQASGFVTTANIVRGSLNIDNHNIRSSIGPHSFTQLQNIALIGHKSGIDVYRANDLKFIKTISGSDLRGIHTVSFSPNQYPNNSKVLVSSSSMERLIELDIGTEERLRTWDTRQSGFNRNHIGIQILKKGEAPVQNNPHLPMTELSFEAAKALTLSETAKNHSNLPEFDNHFVILPQEYDIEMKGYEWWMRCGYPNWANYADHQGESAYVSFLLSGHAVKVDLNSQNISVIRSNLWGPHGYAERTGGRLITNTERGHVEFYNDEHQLENIYDFTGFALPGHIEDIGQEWLQQTIEIEQNVFATIDYRRSQIIIWNPKLRVMDRIDVDPSWQVQGLQEHRR